MPVRLGVCYVLEVSGLIYIFLHQVLCMYLCTFEFLFILLKNICDDIVAEKIWYLK